MRKLPPAPVPYAKALPASVATWLAVRKLHLPQWGAVRVCLFLLRILFGAGRQGALAAPKRVRSKKERRAPHVRSARQQRHVYFSSLPFCFELSLWRCAAPRCNVGAWLLSLSFSSAHAAAIPLPFDALPRRVTPKLAGFIVPEWGALAALGF